MTFLRRALFRPIDGASLAFYRVGFGLLGVLWLGWLAHSGAIVRYWVEPHFHFHYAGLPWLAPWSGVGLALQAGVMAVAAACVALGSFTRVAAFVFALGFTHLFLLDASLFENHYHVFLLLSWLLVCVPAGRVFSVDAWRRERNGAAASDFVPAWGLYLLRAQWAVVFFYGAVNKLNLDWLQGWPLLLWLPDAPRIALLGPFFDEPWMALLWSYTGLVFDFSIVPLLLYRPTRDFAFVALFLFFGISYLVLGVGFFAVLGVLSGTLFFEPDWPRRAFRTRLAAGAETPTQRSPRTEALGVVLIVVYVLVQVLLPLRHWLYPGDASWTEEGQRFAWRMMLRDKKAEVRFDVTDTQTGETFSPDPMRWLNQRQLWVMAREPELIRQFANHLSREYGGATVRVKSAVALNGRRPQPMLDPEVDLGAVPFRLGAAPWIVPLREPLRSPNEVLAAPRPPSHPPR